MATSVLMPFPFFHDDDGTPIDGGYIYIGEYQLDPESSPKAVFWDAGLTIPAPQPLRTRFGFIYREGTPARVYVDGNYSIRAKDSNLVTVFTDKEPPTGNVILGTMALLDAGTGSTQFRDNSQNDARFVLQAGFSPGSDVTFNSITASKMKIAATGKRPLDLMTSIASGRVLTALLPNLSSNPAPSLGFSSIQETPNGGAVLPINLTPFANPIAKLRRCSWESILAATNAIGGLHFNVVASSSVGGAYLGSATLGGGFDLKMRVAPWPGPTVATCRARFGLCSAQNNTDVEPSSIDHTIYFGWDAADTNCQIIYRATGSATKINLGATFPVPNGTADTLYSIRFYSPYNQTSVVNYEVTEEITGATASGTFTHPTAQTASFHPQAYVSAGGTSTKAGVIFVGMPLLELGE